MAPLRDVLQRTPDLEPKFRAGLKKKGIHSKPQETALINPLLTESSRYSYYMTASEDVCGGNSTQTARLKAYESTLPSHERAITGGELFLFNAYGTMHPVRTHCGSWYTSISWNGAWEAGSLL